MSISNTNNISSVPAQQGAVNAASGLSDSKIKENKNLKFVLEPPQIRPYSFYNELQPKMDMFMNYLSTTPVVSKELKQSKRKSLLAKLLKLAAVAAAGFIAFKNRTFLKNVLVNGYNKVRILIKH